MLQMPISLSILDRYWQIGYVFDAFFQGASYELLPTIQFDVEKNYDKNTNLPKGFDQHTLGSDFGVLS